MSCIDLIRIGNNIKDLREQYDETQKDLAAFLHLTPSAISKIENGENEIDIGKLAIISKHYNITIDELVFSDKIRVNYFKRNKVSNEKRFTIFDFINNLLFFPENPYNYHEYLKYKINLYTIFTSNDVESNIKKINADICAQKEDLIDELIKDYERNENCDSMHFILCINLEYAIIISFWLNQIINKSNFIKAYPEDGIQKYNRIIASQIEFLNHYVNLNFDFFDHDELNIEKIQEQLIGAINNVWLSLTYMVHYNNDLFCYYNAIMYLWDLVDNDRNEIQNLQYGCDLLLSAANIDNSYAKTHLAIMHEWKKYLLYST